MVDSVSTTTSTSSTSSSSTSSSDSTEDTNADISKEEFLQLMITQLKYQDPLDPTDSVDYSAQLAQFSSLEQLTNLNDNMTTFIEANYALTQSVYNTMTTNLIGKEAKISGNELTNTGQDDITIGFNLSGSPKSTTIKIYNSDEKLVRTIDDQTFVSGDNKLSWDFTDNDGNALSEGTYTFEVETESYDSSEITVETFVYGTIDSVRFSDDGTSVIIDGIEYPISDILEVLGGDDTSNTDDSKDDGK
jgi:flagellar basal-body rod modification protein FlgD